MGVITGGQFGISPLGDLAFSFGGADWCFTWVPVSATYPTGTFQVDKSTDHGTTWTTITSTSMVGPQTMVLDGNDVLVVYAIGNPVTNLQVQRFSLLTQTWGSISTLLANPGVTYWQSNGVTMHLVRRGAGDFLLYYSAVKVGGQNRIAYSTFDGVTTFGSMTYAPGQSGDDYLLSGAAFDSVSSVTTAMVVKKTAGALLSIGLSGSNVFGSFQTVTTGMAFSSAGYSCSQPIIATMTATSYVVVGATVFDFDWALKVYNAPVALNPTWSAPSLVIGGTNITKLPVPYTLVGIARMMSIAASGTKISVQWTNAPDESPSDTLFFLESRTDQSLPFSWSSPVTILDPNNPPLSQTYRPYQVYSFIDSGSIIIIGLSPADDLSGTVDLSTMIGSPPPPLVLDCNNPPQGTVGVAYSHQISITGGTSPYTVTVIGGSLPPGLTIDNTGLITGTPTLSGTYGFQLHVADSGSQTGNLTCEIIVIFVGPCPEGTGSQIGPG